MKEWNENNIAYQCVHSTVDIDEKALITKNFHFLSLAFIKTQIHRISIF